MLTRTFTPAIVHFTLTMPVSHCSRLHLADAITMVVISAALLLAAACYFRGLAIVGSAPRQFVHAGLMIARPSGRDLSSIS